MIEQLYFDLAEESNDTIIYGKHFQECKAAAEELLGAERGNELQSDFREVMRFV